MQTKSDLLPIQGRGKPQMLKHMLLYPRHGANLGAKKLGWHGAHGEMQIEMLSGG
jgi:hypothetical protein